MIVLLDAGPLGQVSNPNASPVNQQCKQWLADLLAQGAQVRVPEIADYEVRRELLRARRTPGIARLDQLITTVGYVPLTTATMLQAAEFWAQARQQGMPTAMDAALDGDVFVMPPSTGAEDLLRMPNDGYRYELCEGELVREMTQAGVARILLE